MKTIKLSNSIEEVLVDDEDYELLSKFTWRRHPLGYAIRNMQIWFDGVSARSSGRPNIRMHRQLLGAGKGMAVDHVNGLRLDNQKSNLRLYTTAEHASLSRTKNYTDRYCCPKCTYAGKAREFKRIAIRS